MLLGLVEPDDNRPVALNAVCFQERLTVSSTCLERMLIIDSIRAFPVSDNKLPFLANGEKVKLSPKAILKRSDHRFPGHYC